MDRSWLEDSELEKIDKRKLAFMLQVARECDGKSPKEMLPIIMTASKKSKQLGLQLTTQEAGIMMHIIQSYSTPEEREKVDQMLKHHNPSSSCM